MGIIFSNAGLMAKAKQNNVCFDSILTIGHLNLYLTERQIRQLADRYGRRVDPSEFREPQYANRFLQTFFDARSVKSLDYSDYEGCDIVHDMNLPIDSGNYEKFDVVIDGGTLEHIFNFPVAIANCMNMVKTGGSLFLFTMANNHAGHGFYQFSPELFYRIFQPENGFEMRDLILEIHQFPGAELSRTTRCYSVVDPASVRSRVGLVSKSPVMMMVHAVKTGSQPIFTKYPIQSDYAALFLNGGHESLRIPESGLVPSLKRIARQCVPVPVKKWIDGHRQLWQYSFSNRRFYKRWYPV